MSSSLFLSRRVGSNLDPAVYCEAWAKDYGEMVQDLLDQNVEKIKQRSREVFGYILYAFVGFASFRTPEEVTKLRIEVDRTRYDQWVNFVKKLRDGTPESFSFEYGGNTYGFRPNSAEFVPAAKDAMLRCAQTAQKKVWAQTEMDRTKVRWLRALWFQLHWDLFFAAYSVVEVGPTTRVDREFDGTVYGNFLKDLFSNDDSDIDGRPLRFQPFVHFDLVEQNYNFVDGEGRGFWNGKLDLLFVGVCLAMAYSATEPPKDLGELVELFAIEKMTEPGWVLKFKSVFGYPTE